MLSLDKQNPVHEAHTPRNSGMLVGGASPASRSGSIPVFKPYIWRAGTTYPVKLRQKLELELAIAGQD